MGNIKALKEVSENTNYVSILNLNSHLKVSDRIRSNSSYKENISKFLKDNSKEIKSESLNIESSFSKNKNENYYKVANWASGGEPFVRSKDDSLTEFIDQLFEYVAAQIVSHNINCPPILARNNLFHEHMMYDNTDNDLIIVFHAFEYPQDLEQYRSKYAKVLEPDIPTFSSSDKFYKQRNSIWSLNKNTIWNINYCDNSNPFRNLLQNSEIKESRNPLFLNEENVGIRLADVNTFPNEGVRPFMRIF